MLIRKLTLGVSIGVVALAFMGTPIQLGFDSGVFSPKHATAKGKDKHKRKYKHGHGHKTKMKVKSSGGHSTYKYEYTPTPQRPEKSSGNPAVDRFFSGA